MFDKTIRSFVAAVLLTATVSAGAQGPRPGGARGEGPGGPMDGMFAFEGLVGRLGGRTVSGKPFFANVTITRDQKLADGTAISNATKGVVARDVAGSTYRRMQLPAIGPLANSGSGEPPEFAHIRDVTANKNYMLNVRRQTYREAEIRQPSESDNRRRRPARREGQGKAPDQNPNRGNVNTVSEVVTYESLPNVQYTKSVRTIRKGQIGNSADIVITTERWFSPDLQILLKQTHNDPRFGTSAYALSGITLTPDPGLFAVPSGYTLEQNRDGNRRRGPGPGGPPPPPPQD